MLESHWLGLLEKFCCTFVGLLYLVICLVGHR